MDQVDEIGKDGLLVFTCMCLRLTWSQSGPVHQVGADTLEECENRNTKVVGLVRIQHVDGERGELVPLKQWVVLILESNDIYKQTIVNT